MSTKKNDPSFSDFDFPEDDVPQHATEASADWEDPEQDLGGPVPNRTTHVREEQEHEPEEGGDFADIHPGEEDHFQHEEDLPGDPGEVNPSPRKKSFMAGPFFLPTAGGVLLVLAGGALWHSGVFSRHTVVAPPMFPNQPGPRYLPPAGSGIPGRAPIGAPIAPPVRAPIAPALPAFSSTQSTPSAQPPEQDGWKPALAAPQQAAHLASPSDSSQQPAAVEHDDSQLVAAVQTLVASTTKLSDSMDSHFHAYEQSGSDLKQAIFNRLDQTDSKISSIGDHVATLDTQVQSVEQRLTVLETDHAPHAKPPQVETEAHARHTQTWSSLRGYALKGVAAGEAPTSAYILTPGGYMLVKVGEPIGGAGTVTAIRRIGRSWELVTTRGVVRP
jgi:hypothetical protein